MYAHVSGDQRGLLGIPLSTDLKISLKRRGVILDANTLKDNPSPFKTERRYHTPGRLGSALLVAIKFHLVARDRRPGLTETHLLKLRTSVGLRVPKVHRKLCRDSTHTADVG